MHTANKHIGNFSAQLKHRARYCGYRELKIVRLQTLAHEVPAQYQ